MLQSLVLFFPQLRLLMLVSAVFMFLRFSALPARADYYLFENGGHSSYGNPQTIGEPEYFHYVYGILNRGEGVVDYYEMRASTTISDFHIELMVQDKTARREFHPSLIIIDPNSSRMIGTVPFDFPLSADGRVYEWRVGAETKRVDETIWENLLVGHSLVRTVAPPQLKIAVFDPEHKGGRYVLRLGAKNPPETIQYKLGQLFALLRVKFDLY